MRIIKKNTLNYADLEFKKEITYSQYKKIYNKILIYRRTGGLGDVVNTIPLFSEIKRLYPFLHITYAVPEIYHVIFKNNPNIDNLIDVKSINLNEYGYASDISSICGKYEMSMAPYVDKHRSDIWSELALGLKLSNHDFDLYLKEEIKEKIKTKYGNSVKLGIFPRSASSSKDLEDHKLIALINELKEMNYDPYIIDFGTRLEHIDCKIINNISIEELIYLINQLDYAISVDTGVFHICSICKIPTVGIFTWTDGKILSKYHSNIQIVQKHRDFEDGLKCCPCWNWCLCIHKQKGVANIPLECMRQISVESIINKFKKIIQNNK